MDPKRLRTFAPHIPKFLLSESANFNFMRILGEGRAHSDGFDPTVLLMGGYQWLLFTLSGVLALREKPTQKDSSW
jgi:hypothetical protein